MGMRKARNEVLGLSEIDQKILKELDNFGVLKANVLAKNLETSRQAVAYRLRVLENRGFVKFVPNRGWEVGTYWKNLQGESAVNGDGYMETVAGLENIVERLKNILKQNISQIVYVIENVNYNSLTQSERSAWKKMDKVLDDLFVQSGVLLRGVGSQESLRMFLESQKELNDGIDENRKLVYKIVPIDLLRLPYEKPCSTAVLGDLVLNFFFKEEKLEIIKNREYANLVTKFYNLAEGYGRQVDLNKELQSLRLS